MRRCRRAGGRSGSDRAGGHTAGSYPSTLSAATIALQVAGSRQQMARVLPPRRPERRWTDSPWGVSSLPPRCRPRHREVCLFEIVGRVGLGVAVVAVADARRGGWSWRGRGEVMVGCARVRQGGFGRRHWCRAREEGAPAEARAPCESLWRDGAMPRERAARRSTHRRPGTCRPPLRSRAEARWAGPHPGSAVRPVVAADDREIAAGWHGVQLDALPSQRNVAMREVAGPVRVVLDRKLEDGFDSAARPMTLEDNLAERASSIQARIAGSYSVDRSFINGRAEIPRCVRIPLALCGEVAQRVATTTWSSCVALPDRLCSSLMLLAGGAGKCTWMSSPPSGRARVLMVAWWASAMAWTMERPRPWPSGWLVRAGSSRWSGSNSRATCDGGIFGPSLVTDRIA
jgi:hypothetical protein